jgi:hypothetical protein
MPVFLLAAFRTSGATTMRIRKAAGLGAGIGGALGASFGLAVVSFADCARPNCAYERIVGVLGHTAGGAGGGGALGLLLLAISRVLVWFRDVIDP